MPLTIRELHPASSPAALNEEWILVENTGTAPINTSGCTLSVSNKGKQGRPRALGTLDPGFAIKPGEKVRMVTGSPAKKAQGAAPAEEGGVRNYHLFLKDPVLAQPGVVLHLMLKQHELCSATYAPSAPAGVEQSGKAA
jgi:hypothetical protein